MTDQQSAKSVDQIQATHVTPWVGDRRGVIGRIGDPAQLYACLEIRIPLGEIGGQQLHIHATLPLGVVQLWASDGVDKQTLEPMEVDIISGKMSDALYDTLQAMEVSEGFLSLTRAVKSIGMIGEADAEVGKSDEG